MANGNLKKKVTLDVMGEILELKNTINTMVDQLNSFAYEVEINTRILALARAHTHVARAHTHTCPHL